MQDFNVREAPGEKVLAHLHVLCESKEPSGEAQRPPNTQDPRRLERIQNRLERSAPRDNDSAFG
jgi:hypothetical protein